MKVYLGNTWGHLGVGLLFIDGHQVLLYKRSESTGNPFQWSYISGACCTPQDEQGIQHFQGDERRGRAVPREMLIKNVIKELIEEMGVVAYVPDIYYILESSQMVSRQIFPNFTFHTFIVDIRAHPSLTVLRDIELLKQFMNDENIDLGWFPIHDIHGSGDQIREVLAGCAELVRELWNVPIPIIQPRPNFQRLVIDGWMCFKVPKSMYLYHGSQSHAELNPKIPTYYSIDPRISLRYCYQYDWSYLQKFQVNRSFMLLDLHDQHNISRLLSIFSIDHLDPQMKLPRPYKLLKTIGDILTHMNVNQTIQALKRTLFDDDEATPTSVVKRASASDDDAVLVMMIYLIIKFTSQLRSIRGYYSQHDDAYYKRITTPLSNTEAITKAEWGSECLIFRSSDLQRVGSSRETDVLSTKVPGMFEPRMFKRWPRYLEDYRYAETIVTNLLALELDQSTVSVPK